MPCDHSKPVFKDRTPESMLNASVLNEIDRIRTVLDEIGTQQEQSAHLAELGACSSMFAHEVNNLMTQVGGRAQLAQMNMDKPELISRALELACHASTQIAQLCELFLSSADTEPIHQDQSDIHSVHHRALEFIDDQDIQALGFELLDDADHPSISISPTLLEQVLINLYLNAIVAIKESPKPSLGRISIRIEQIESACNCSTGNNQTIKIAVTDTGIGMNPKQIEQMFNTKNGGSERDNGHGGHGIGLAVCKKLITQARGTITAQSAPGQGTTMIITLPTKIGPANAADSSKTQAA